MVKGVIEGVKASLKYRGGWRGFYEHMYTVSSDGVHENANKKKFVQHLLFLSNVFLFQMNITNFLYIKSK